MQFEWHATTPVPAKAALAWWFDVREDDHADPAFADIHGAPGPQDGRTVLARHPERVRVRDVLGGGKMVHTAEVRKANDHTLVVDGKAGMLEDHLRLTFLPKGTGSEIVVRGSLDFRGLGKLLAP
ncbi:MAG: hypothetical protein R3185_01990, partial [Candidatus Thermoplasmatota archaeon]|nr:hypothetical protein [Candidatus Thermoplasmatota archaeon]